MSASENNRRADIPKSMAEELGAWNNGEGISLDGWINFEGNFRLAAGYTTLFWPQFVAFEDYIFRKGFTEEKIRGFESQDESTAQSVEWIVNHLHLSDIHCHDQNDISSDKLVMLGNCQRNLPSKTSLAVSRKAMRG